MQYRYDYTEILVESFYSWEDGHRGRIHIRPTAGQAFSQDLLVECSRQMTDEYPVGTIFRLCVCLMQKLDGRPHLYAHYKAAFQVVELGSAQ